MTGGGKPPGMKVAAAMCDKPVQKMSLKERLEAFKTQAAGTDRADTEKSKGRRKRCRHKKSTKILLQKRL